MADVRILLISGHGAGDPGACGYMVEADETRRVVQGVKNHFNGYNVDLDLYPMNRNAYADVKNGCPAVNFANYDYVLEVHFNSCANPSATGVEIFVTNAEAGIGVEQNIVNNIAALGFVNRGVKREDFLVIRSAKAKGTSSALLEVCFVSNQNDTNNYKAKFDAICKAIVNGIVKGFSISGQAKQAVNKPYVPTSTPKTNYVVKTKEGKQLGAFNVYEYAVNMAKSNKAIVYSTKNGAVVCDYTPKVSARRYAENGTFVFTTAVQVRSQAKDGYETGACYYPGEKVIYHHKILNQNGFDWVEYLRTNGQTGYMKIKDCATGEYYGYTL